MLNDIPSAKLYVLLPVEKPSVVLSVGDTRICGGKGSTLTFSQLLMNEIAKVMTDEDIIGFAGLNLERCMLIVGFSEKHCNDILNHGVVALQEVFKEHPHLVPTGGVGLQFRNWGDIPDSEKAGRK